eukprot:6616119-Karenia_brevis.AAC.1
MPVSKMTSQRTAPSHTTTLNSRTHRPKSHRAGRPTCDACQQNDLQVDGTEPHFATLRTTAVAPKTP